MGGPVAPIPGIKALLSVRVTEALLVAAGLAGVGAWALRLFLDGNRRAVKCHRCNRHRRVDVHKKNNLHTAGFVCPFHTLPCHPSPVDTGVAKLRVQKANSPVCSGISFTCQPKMLKWLWGCREALGCRQSNKWTLIGVQTVSHTRQFQQLFGCILTHFSSLVETQQQPKLPSCQSQAKS